MEPRCLLSEARVLPRGRPKVAQLARFNTQVVKTLRCEPFTDEVSLLVRAAAQMAAHFEAHPASLLARIFGVYSMRLYDQTIYFVVMSNVYRAARGAVPLLRYDLKGSWVNRLVVDTARLGGATSLGLLLQALGLLAPRLLGAGGA